MRRPIHRSTKFRPDRWHLSPSEINDWYHTVDQVKQAHHRGIDFGACRTYPALPASPVRLADPDPTAPIVGLSRRR